MLLDSNIIVYAAQPAFEEIRSFIEQYTPAVSAISYLEVLGYHKLSADEREKLVEFFASTQILPITDSVIDQAITLRQIRKMSLGDSIIAGTALHFGRKLVTRNIADFDWIEGLAIIDPLRGK